MPNISMLIFSNFLRSSFEDPLNRSIILNELDAIVTEDWLIFIFIGKVEQFYSNTRLILILFIRKV